MTTMMMMNLMNGMMMNEEVKSFLGTMLYLTDSLRIWNDKFNSAYITSIFIKEEEEGRTNVTFPFLIVLVIVITCIMVTIHFLI